MKNKTFFAFSLIFLLLSAITPFLDIGGVERGVVGFFSLLFAAKYFVRAFHNPKEICTTSLNG